MLADGVRIAVSLINQVVEAARRPRHGPRDANAITARRPGWLLRDARRLIVGPQIGAQHGQEAHKAKRHCMD